MTRSRTNWLLFWGGLVGSLIISVLGLVAYVYLGWPFLFLFLLFPFLPFAFGRWRRETSDAALELKRCPTCDYETGDPLASFCPRDASRLQAGPKSL